MAETRRGPSHKPEGQVIEEIPPDAICISSYTTVMYKWVFPFVFFGVALYLLGDGLLVVSWSENPYPGYGEIVIAPLLLVFYYFLFRKLSFQLMSQVWMTEDALILVKGLRTLRVSMRNIARMDLSESSNLGRVVLYLVQPCAWGDRVEFIPAGGSLRFPSLSPMVQELSSRLRQARKGGQERRATENSARSARASR